MDSKIQAKRVKKRGFKKFLFFILFAILFIFIGLIISLITVGAVKETSGVNFCQSCHAMKPMVNAYKNSVHGGFGKSGVVAQCAECHLPHNSTLGYLIAKAKTGMWDLWVQSTHDTSKIDWEAKRKHKREFVYDSGCLHCHKNLLKATKTDHKAHLAHKAYFSKKLKINYKDKRVLAKCVDCHRYVGHYELSKYLPKIGDKVDEKYEKLSTIIVDIAKNLKKGSHEYYFKDVEISDEEVNEINITKIATEYQKSRKEKIEKLMNKVEELEKQLNIKLEKELFEKAQKDIKELTLAKKIAIEETKLHHTIADAKIKKFMDIKDFPKEFRPFKKYLHEPFKKGACLICHIEDSKKKGKLVTKGKMSNLCYECHPLKVKKRFKHKPTDQGSCIDCHDPHQADTKHLLKEVSINDLCIKCHDSTNGKKFVKKRVDINAKFIHSPIKKDCLLCHEHHTSNYKNLLKKSMKKGKLCMDCHKDENDKNVKKIIKIENITYKHGSINRSKKSCLECHNPHSSDRKNLLKKPQIKLCLSCHNKSIKSNEDGYEILNMKKHLNTNPNWHKPIKDVKKEGGCVACHNPHGSNHFSMLKKSYSKKFYDELNPKEFICYTCHKINKIKTKYTTKYTNFRDGNKNLHFVHAGDKKGRACRACHDEHASKYSHLIRDYTDFNGIKFPLRYIETKNGGSCQPACHKRFEYDRKNPKNLKR